MGYFYSYITGDRVSKCTGKANYTEAKAYHPVSLTSFLLKMREKLVDRHTRDNVLRNCPLYQNQFSYQEEKSTETVHHNAVMQ